MSTQYWTKKRTDLLRQLIAAEVPANKIAARLGEGVTRNAVIGKINRLRAQSGDRRAKSVESRARRRLTVPADQVPVAAQTTDRQSRSRKRTVIKPSRSAKTTKRSPERSGNPPAKRVPRRATARPADKGRREDAKKAGARQTRDRQSTKPKPAPRSGARQATSRVRQRISVRPATSTAAAKPRKAVVKPKAKSATGKKLKSVARPAAPVTSDTALQAIGAALKKAVPSKKRSGDSRKRSSKPAIKLPRKSIKPSAGPVPEAGGVRESRKRRKPSAVSKAKPRSVKRVRRGSSASEKARSVAPKRRGKLRVNVRSVPKPPPDSPRPKVTSAKTAGPQRRRVKSGGGTTKPRQTRAKTTVRKPRVRGRTAPRVVAKPPKPSSPAAVKPQMIGMLELTDQHCRWPIGDPNDAKFGFCGNPIMPRKVYCEVHVNQAYQPLLPRREGRRGRPPQS